MSGKDQSNANRHMKGIVRGNNTFMRPNRLGRSGGQRKTADLFNKSNALLTIVWQTFDFNNRPGVERTAPLPVLACT
jgi:hypothetical protein